jgi:PTH1 family peptidyl-tRNA hydrolase
MTAVQLIVGLGNPGPEYDQTRHNAGALFVERLADSQRINLSLDKKYFGLTGKFSHQGRDVRLLIPTTFMNRSGQAVAALANFFRIPPEAILVAHDELDMPPGVAKLKQGGGHGGHNGLRDIIGRAPRSEQELLDTSIDFALGVLPEILAGDWSKAMHKLHSQKASS